MRRGTAVLPLCKSPPTYYSIVEVTTCISILHSLWIGPFSGGVRCGFFVESDGWDIR